MGSYSVLGVLVWLIAACVGGGPEPGTPTGESGVSVSDTHDTGPRLTAADPPDDAGLRRMIDSGALVGAEEDDSYAFLGVPFAAPPVDALRWRRPEPVAPWAGDRPAHTFAERCTQSTDSFVFDVPPGPTVGTEDCLYLNVWTPRDADPDERLPVVFFVHGGGNTYGGTFDPIDTLVHPSSGFAETPLYGGARLAHDAHVVVVTTSYRLGALGYLAHPALDAERSPPTSGNYGLYDIVAALEWVQRNVATFQGDASRVLLVGQSGGARDVNALATCETRGGLFSRLAVHSAPLGLKPLAESHAQAALLVDEMGCPGTPAEVAACMRAVSAEDLVLAEASVPLGLASGAFLPTLDGSLCVEQPVTVLARGGLRVPMILGTMDDEYSHRWSGISAEQYPTWVAAMVGLDDASAVLAQYPLSRFPSPTVAFTDLMSDRNVTCPHRRYARIGAAAGETVFFYRFRERLTPEARIGYGAYHTTDFLFFFRHMDGLQFPVDADDVAAQDVMLRYWTRFAAQGDPAGGTLGIDPVWPSFALDDESYLSVEASPSVQQDLEADDCDFWDALAEGGG